jgi:hypothetical protein
MARTFSLTAMQVTAGLLIWLADFLVIYVVAALACARGFAAATWLGVDIVGLVSALATLAACVATIGVVFVGRRKARTASADAREDGASLAFLGELTLWAAVLGLLATVLTALPGLLLTRLC